MERPSPPSRPSPDVQEFLKRLNPAWNVVGGVHFHVAEKPRGRRGALRRPCHLHVAAYREALDLFRALSAESAGVASGLSALAEAERVSGDLTAAERDYREALRVARAVGDADGMAAPTIRGNLAELALDQNDWPGGRTVTACRPAASR